jgi:hypothetical protein
MNKIKVGFFSFTEITDPNEHRSYNEWHQLDHMPEQFPLEGVAHGQRWVSTPACRAARLVSDARLDPIDYVTLYLMTEPVQRTLDEFMELGAELHRLGRFHHFRRAHMSGPLLFESACAAKRVLVSPEAIPYRPHRGIYVIVERDHDAAGAQSSADWLGVPGVAGIWTFATSPRRPSQQWSIEGARITVAWLDDDPLACAAMIAPLVHTADDRVVFAGPFETITPWQWDWFDDSPPT